MAEALPPRPERFDEAPVPPIPAVQGTDPEAAEVQLSYFETSLSHYRTGLSEHRTDLSEYRTDLSTHRTALSDTRTKLSVRRSTMSVHRSRMGSDRTLMSVIRTALSLIGFGFTIYQGFERLRQAGVIVSAAAPRNFGVTLIVFGILLLIGGIWRHAQFEAWMRHLRVSLLGEDLPDRESPHPLSVTLIAAILLLLFGLAALGSIALA